MIEKRKIADRGNPFFNHNPFEIIFIPGCSGIRPPRCALPIVKIIHRPGTGDCQRVSLQLPAEVRSAGAIDCRRIRIGIREIVLNAVFFSIAVLLHNHVLKIFAGRERIFADPDHGSRQGNLLQAQTAAKSQIRDGQHTVRNNDCFKGVAALEQAEFNHRQRFRQNSAVQSAAVRKDGFPDSLN